MKHFFFILFLIATCHLSASNWEENWKNAVEYCHREQYDLAEQEFTLAIQQLESANDDKHFYVFVDRARLYALQGQYTLALPDLDKALLSNTLSTNDKIRALVTRIVVNVNLGLEEQALSDYDSFTKIKTDLPQVEFTEETVIIRNIPDCDCYMLIAKAFLVNSGICENESDIKVLPSGVCIAKRKNCDCDKNASKPMDVQECRYWCDKLAFAGLALCSKTFKTWGCQTACFAVVELLKDGCHWCCSNGEFYRKCVQPFEDIFSKMGKTCDPAWD